MIGAVRYSAANAAIRAALSKLLTEETWVRLLEAQNLEQAVETLRSTPYGRSMGPVDLAELERSITSRAAKRMRIPMPFLRGKSRDLLDLLWRQHEVENLVVLLRSIHGGADPTHARHLMVDLAPESKLEWNALARTRGVPELADELERSADGRLYALAIRSARSEYERRGTVFVVEVSLYLAYYRQLRRLVERMRGADGRDSGKLLGTALDTRNLLWAFRYRLHFGLSAETVAGYTLPRGDRVDARIVREAAEGASPAELAGRLWGDELEGLEALSRRPRDEQLTRLELLFRRLLYGRAREALRRFPLRLGSILAYAVVVKAEAEDLIAILEAKLDESPRDRIEKELVMRGERP